MLAIELEFHHPTTRVACAGGLNGVGNACDGRACWLPWPPSCWLEPAFEDDEPELLALALPSELSSSAGVVVGGGSLWAMCQVRVRVWVWVWRQGDNKVSKRDFNWSNYNILFGICRNGSGGNRQGCLSYSPSGHSGRKLALQRGWIDRQAGWTTLKSRVTANAEPISDARFLNENQSIWSVLANSWALFRVFVEGLGSKSRVRRCSWLVFA